MENLNYIPVNISLGDYINYLTSDDTMKKFMIEYTEHHRKNHPHNKKDDITLPESLKILSKLKLKEKNISIKENQPTIEFATIIRDDIEPQGYLINELIEFINKKLETKNNLYVTSLVDSLTIIDEKYVVLLSCFHID